jgi:hypothetical protein
MPSEKQIRAYFDDLVSTLEAEPAGARDVLAASFRTIRLVPTATAYRLELTMAEVMRWRKLRGPDPNDTADHPFRSWLTSPERAGRPIPRTSSGSALLVLLHDGTTAASRVLVEEYLGPPRPCPVYKLLKTFHNPEGASFRVLEAPLDECGRYEFNELAGGEDTNSAGSCEGSRW